MVLPVLVFYNSKPDRKSWDKGEKVGGRKKEPDRMRQRKGRGKEKATFRTKE